MTMSALTPLSRFEPLDDLFPEMFRRIMRPAFPATTLAKFEEPSPIRVDVTETDNAYDIRAEVPGFKKDEIRVSIDGNYVSISAETKREKEEKSEKSGKGERTLVKELYYGSASRGFSLPQDVDEKTAVAKYEDGLLKLNLPKKTESSRKTLSIQ
jgi:HSP20 family protein